MLKSTIFYGLVSLFCMFPLFMLPWNKSVARSELVTIQFAIIGIISVYMLIRECYRHSFSLMMMHWFYIYVFLFCAGVTQFANNSYLWELYTHVDTNIYSNALIILWEIVAVIVSFVKLKRKKNIYREKTELKIEYSVSKYKTLIIIGILIAVGLYPLLTNGIITYFSRAIYGKHTLTYLTYNISIKLVLDSMIIGFCLWSTLIAIRRYSSNVISKVTLILSILALFLNVPPFGLPRFEIAAVYGGILLYSFKFVKRNNSFLALLFICIFFLFPFLNAFRYNSISDLDMTIMIANLGSVSSNFMRADYDSYSMLLYSVEYIRFFGCAYGYQLLGVLFFFIPSAFWLNKPDGSGSTIINSMTIGIDGNVSCPIIAEGFMNFEVLGVILFCIIFTNILKYFDNKYWSCDNDTTFNMIYCCSVPFIVFIMRGDLMSTTAFYSGFYASLFVYRKMFFKRR